MKYTVEVLAPLVTNSFCWREVCIQLGLKPLAGSRDYLKKLSEKYGISFSHFKEGPPHTAKRVAKRTIEEYFSGAPINSNVLRDRLIKEGYKDKSCEHCMLSEWNGKPIPLDLDHINSDHFDNRLENLQILCSNCHRLKTREDLNQKLKIKKARKLKATLTKFQISKEELENLVWKMPMKEIAKLYQVGNTSIKRKCDHLNIIVPFPGYWKIIRRSNLIDSSK